MNPGTLSENRFTQMAEPDYSPSRVPRADTPEQKKIHKATPEIVVQLSSR
jgi:hypothetical protein